MEFFGTFIVWWFITVVVLVGEILLGKKCSIRAVNDDRLNLQVYSTSLLFFTCISLPFFLLLVFLNYFFSNMSTNNVLIKSGLASVMFLLIFGIIIQLGYSLIVKFSNKPTKQKHLYALNSCEIKWIFVFELIALIILFFAIKQSEMGTICLVLLLGKFIWLDFGFDAIKSEINSLKELPGVYWGVMTVMLLIILEVILYNGNSVVNFSGLTISATLGTVFGIIATIVIILIIENHNSHLPDDTGHTHYPVV